VVRADGVLGSYRPRTHDVTEMRGCRVHAPEVEVVVEAIRVALAAQPIPLRYVLVRGALAEGSTVVTLVARRAQVEGLDAVVRRLATREDVARVVLNINDGEGDALLGETDIVLHDGPAPRERLGSITASLAAGAFSQVNPLAAARLYGVVVEEAEPAGRSVLDLYCGSGGIALALAAAGARRVLAVDVDPRAAAAAEASVTENGLQDRVEVRAARAEDVDAAAEIVILNPPRKGAARPVLEAVSALRPVRLVYVSCNPKSLARDLRVLEELGPVLTRRVVPVDLFPHTRHVETILSLDLPALEA
jgi:23S rRNA (uracil1939-C5)-methyltransferase